MTPAQAAEQDMHGTTATVLPSTKAPMSDTVVAITQHNSTEVTILSTTEQEMSGEEEPDYVMGVVGAVFGLVLLIVGVTLTIGVCVIAASRRKINSSTQQNK